MQQQASEPSYCLVCGERPIQARGLCTLHHSRFHREMRDLTAEQKVIYQQTLIERGLLLPPKSPGRQVTKDPFKEVAAELFVAESKPSFSGRQRKKQSRKKAGRKKSSTIKRSAEKKSTRTRKSPNSETSARESD